MKIVGQRRQIQWRLVGLAMLGVAFAASAPAVRADAKVDFNREIRPLLTSKCGQCHGPDDKARKAGLRLDVRERATKPLKSGETAIVPGKPGESAMIARIMATDDDDVMPPPKHGPRLKEEEIATLRKWIEQGAPYAQHWAYVKPLRPALPEVKDAAWPIDEIDRFVLARLENEGLHPSPPADRYALIRRVSLDLTGLPPTIEEADTFANDKSPDAYEKIVDRLLASPAYGERWAQVWLDLARYADSQGFAPDEARTIWRWRDWLIRALNANEPFDQFTIDMLAGDMLPNATQEQIVATGFHRNTLVNTEGGINPDEFAAAAIVDRVNTTMQVWMASTFACCQCHNHKYDPFTQKEYYQLYAIFNSTEDYNNDKPAIDVPQVGMEEQFAELQPKYNELKAKLDAANKEVDAKRDEWEKTAKADALPKEVRKIFEKPAKERKKPEQDKLTEYFRSQSKEWKELETAFKKTEAEYKAVSTTTPVMKQIPQRETFVHLRGNFEAKGDKVAPALPAAFPPPPAGEPVNRLTLARWLVSPENPLTARVAVNRLWEELFGIGIVETAEDFGTQGELPSHPELLDWLATEYVRLGWDTRKLIRLIVTSATYHQSTGEPESLATRDPLNRLLARGPRVRLAAETVRDEALFAAGLLSRKLYGPPCQPPKPNFGLAAAFGPTTDWKADTGEERWRRGIYVRVRRNAPYPSMTTFDAPERTSCTVRRIRTNTPLQALVTLNDPCYVEAAQGLARRIVKEGGETTASRVAFAFRTCLTRPPSEAETKRVAELFEAARDNYAKEPAKAVKLATEPLGPAPKGMDPVDLAGWTVVSNVMLNLDETLAKR
jgi:mono/diheme cytochrome c family protein